MPNAELLLDRFSTRSTRLIDHAPCPSEATCRRVRTAVRDGEVDEFGRLVVAHPDVTSRHQLERAQAPGAGFDVDAQTGRVGVVLREFRSVRCR